METTFKKANDIRIQAAAEKWLKTTTCEIDSVRITFKDAIEKGCFSGTKEGTQPAAYFNRTKFNRMDARKQAQYEKRMEERKPLYCLVVKGGGFYDVPNGVFNYFRALFPNSPNELTNRTN